MEIVSKIGYLLLKILSLLTSLTAPTSYSRRDENVNHGCCFFCSLEPLKYPTASGTDMDGSEERTGAVQHLRQALEADEASEKDYHVKEALQLLDAERTLS